MNTITPHELNELYERDRAIRLIDGRAPAKFGDAHVPFAKNWPLGSLDPAVVGRSRNRAAQSRIYVICQKAGRAATASAKLATAGVEHAVNVEGGTSAWEQAGLPVTRGEKTISLKRPVRIAAGSLVVIGSLLGYIVHPYFIGLAAFVSAGLMFAGITDKCGMGMLLARMPWNQTGAVPDKAYRSSGASP